jgi:hypothetical protein
VSLPDAGRPTEPTLQMLQTFAPLHVPITQSLCCWQLTLHTSPPQAYKPQLIPALSTHTPAPSQVSA